MKARVENGLVMCTIGIVSASVSLTSKSSIS